MKAICWAYTEDGRVCRKPTTVPDPQRGFLVCQEHAPNREQQTNIPSENSIMSAKTKTPSAGAVAEASAPNENRTYRTNPETEAKINDWINTHPKNWAYIQAMPRDRLERTVVLNEIRQLERRQYVDTDVLQKVKNNPELMAAYDVLLKDVPADKRDEAILNIEREKWLDRKTQSQPQTQTQTRREGVRV
jgi:hypothetical protein